MYIPCKEIDDKCFRLDLLGPQIGDRHGIAVYPAYTFEDIPRNCTTFFGSVSLIGPFDEDQLAGKFDNLNLIIGQLHIGMTLLDRLDAIFPKLEVVYPYVFTSIPTGNMIYKFIKTAMPQVLRPDTLSLMNRGFNDHDIAHNFQSVQFVHARINRFLTNWSIPTLSNIRPLDVGNVNKAYYDSRNYINIMFKDSTRDFLDTFLPDTIKDPCVYFPQFNDSCGSLLTPSYIYSSGPTKCYAYEDRPTRDDCVPFEFHYGTWSLSMVCVALGSLFSCRAMLLLLFSKAAKSLSNLRLLLLVPIFIMTMVALENAFMFQKAVRFLGPLLHFLPQFESLHLLHPIPQWIMTFLAASKHACLVFIVLCYVCCILFYKSESRRLSEFFCISVLIGFPILTAYFKSQTFLAIRGVRPRYSKESRQLIYIPFAMNINFAEKFSYLFPESLMIMQNTDEILFSPVSSYQDIKNDLYWATTDFNLNVVDFPLETFGQLLGITQEDMQIIEETNTDIYLHAMKDFRKFKADFMWICDVGMVIAAGLFSFFRGTTKATRCHGLSRILILLYFQLSINRIRFFLHNIVLSSDFCNIKDFFEMLPYTFYLLVSLFCCKFARFHCYLGAALDKEKKQKAEREKETTTIFTFYGEQLK